MTDINRAIAALRGWTDIAERDVFGLDILFLCGIPPDLPPDVDKDAGWYALPDYLLWQHCGVLLEEMTREVNGSVRTEFFPDVASGPIWCLAWRNPRSAWSEGVTLPDAIRRAWKAWKEEK